MTSRSRARSTPKPDPCGLNWAHAAPFEAFHNHSAPIVHFSATYLAPVAPADPHAILYWWIGLQEIHWPKVKSRDRQDPEVGPPSP